MVLSSAESKSLGSSGSSLTPWLRAERARAAPIPNRVSGRSPEINSRTKSYGEDLVTGKPSRERRVDLRRRAFRIATAPYLSKIAERGLSPRRALKDTAFSIDRDATQRTGITRPRQ